MCFYTQQKDTIPKLQKRFNAVVNQPQMFLQSDFINGFSHPNLPVIINTASSIIQTDFHWGLLPTWTNDITFRKNTLNAKIETVTEKPSFTNLLENRCLVIATAFYEWHWLDDKGKNKQKYIIHGEDELFTFAGIYNTWTNPLNGENINTFTILTTAANQTMEYIHNHKKRMPIILKKDDEQKWLQGNIPLSEIAFPYQSNLIGFEV